MGRADTGDRDDEQRETRLLENPDGHWTARDLQAEISAQGETRAAALENLDGVVAAVSGDGGHEPTDAELREPGIDPETARSQGDDLPDIFDFLRTPHPH